MDDTATQTILAQFPDLERLPDERAKRDLAATEAPVLGRGGIKRVHEPTGMMIEFSSAKGRKRPHRLRPVGYREPETGGRYVFLTTNFAFSAKTVADIYRSRWQVELFFKWIKQNLKIKSFFGTSRNAVMTQIWIPQCVYLLLAYVKFANRLA